MAFSSKEIPQMEAAASDISTRIAETHRGEIRIADPGALPEWGPTAKHVIVNGLDDNIYIRNFKDIRVSTMTLVAFIGGQVFSLDAIYYILPVRHLTKPRITTISPGTVTSVRLKDRFRGEPGRCFKNAAIINVWTREKKISTKLSTQKVQMCGPSSVEMGIEASNYITEHINNAMGFLEAIAADPDHYRKAVEWLLDSTRGEELSTRQVVGREGSLLIYETLPDYHIEWPEVEKIPEEFRGIVEDVMCRCDDLDFHSELRALTSYFPTLEASKVTESLSISRVGRAMVNYNYHLGFKVDRLQLTKLLVEKGMAADYLNTVRTHVTIEICGERSDDINVVRRDAQYDKQSILIYLSGNVMHSGPGGHAMEMYYYHIVGLIAAAQKRVSNLNQ